MNEKLKLPVQVVSRFREGVLDAFLDADGDYVRLTEVADAINATARRCDGCEHFHSMMLAGARVTRCVFKKTDVDADDYCRKGWKAR